jgi:hypothetical protein
VLIDFERRKMKRREEINSLSPRQLNDIERRKMNRRGKIIS